MITAKVAISQKANRVYGYQVNFTNADFICRKFFIAKEQKSPPDVEKLIQRELLPIRLGSFLSTQFEITAYRKLYI